MSDVVLPSRILEYEVIVKRERREKRIE